VADKAAKRLKDRKLQRETLTEEFPALDPHVRPFLEAVRADGGDGTAALAKLETMLIGSPFLLVHPYVWQTVRRLFVAWFPGTDLDKQATEWLHRLVKAWGEGITFGYKVLLESPGPGHGGQTPQLFPNLNNREGWILSDEADRERTDAIKFGGQYHDLMTRLHRAVRWKEKRREYRESLSRENAILPLVEEVAEQVGQAFAEFKKHWGLAGDPLCGPDLSRIARDGLKVPKRRDPRHKVACALFATLPWVDIHGNPQRLTAQLVDSTLDTLKRRGLAGTMARREAGTHYRLLTSQK